MPTPSRQEIAYEKWQETFFKLLEVSKDIPDKTDMITYLRELLGYKGIRENLIQAFSNFMWEMDETIERKVYDELEHLIDFIPLVADPEDVNTLAIQASLTQIVAVGGQETEEINDDEIDNLVGEEEVDDSPIEL